MRTENILSELSSVLDLQTGRTGSDSSYSATVPQLFLGKVSELCIQSAQVCEDKTDIPSKISKDRVTRNINYRYDCFSLRKQFQMQNKLLYVLFFLGIQDI